MFRRPRPAANLKSVTSPDGLFNMKLGVLMDTDPDTGLPSSMNIRTDARVLTLKLQAQGAYSDRQGGTTPLGGDFYPPQLRHQALVAGTDARL